MDDILAKHNRHLFLEEQDNSSNSFIANVNFLVNKFNDIQTINSKFTASDIAAIRKLLDTMTIFPEGGNSGSNASQGESSTGSQEGQNSGSQGASGASQGGSSTVDPSSQGSSSEGVSEPSGGTSSGSSSGSSGSSSGSSQTSSGSTLGAILQDLLKGTYRGCRKLDIDLLLNFKDYNANLSDEAKRSLWNDSSKQVYYDSVEVYFIDRTYITKQFTELVSNHHQLRDELKSWEELASKMGGTGIEIMPHEPIYNHELLRIYDTTLEGSNIDRIVLHVADAEQCSRYKAVFSGVKKLDPEYCWLDTTSSLQLVAGLLPQLLSKSETALATVDEAKALAEEAEDFIRQVKEARDQACECSQEAEEARQEVAENVSTVVEKTAQVLANIASALASAEAAGISARTAQASADAAKASEELAYRHSTNAAVDVLEKVQAGLVTAKYEDYPEYLRAYLDMDGRFLWGIKIDGSIEWSEGVPKPVREEIAKIGYLADNFNEYIRCYTDSEGHLLWGIKKDGSVEWIKGVPTGIKNYLNEHYGEIESDNDYIHKFVDSNNQFIFGIKKDGSINWTKGVPDGLKNYLDSIYGYETSNEEYLRMYADANGQFIFGIRKDGSIEWMKGVPTAIKKYFDTFMYRDDTGTMDLMAMHDANGNVIEAIDVKGHRVFNRDVFIEGDLRVDGRIKGVEQVKGVHNWTRKKDMLHIPIPECAVVKIERFVRPANKIEECQARMEFWDMRGNYFQKKIALGLQGNSTWNLPKPNYKFDLFADDWGGDEFVIQFGDWVAQDSFHLKAFYTDFLCGRAIIVYQWWQEICNTRGMTANTAWKQAMIKMDEVPINMPALGAEEDVELRLDTGAKCVPDGFPCIVYINDQFHGIFSWQLKKHKDNYHLKKNNAKNIQIDGFSSAQNIWMGNVVWRVEELRYPKDLFCEDGTIYDGDLNMNEIMGTDSDIYDTFVANYADYMDLSKGYWKDIRKDGKKEYDKEYAKQIAAGKSESTARSKAEAAQIKAEKKKVQKTLDITTAAKANVERLSNAVPILRELDAAYNADPTPENYQAVRTEFEKYFYPDNLIDYNILVDIDGDGDSVSNNCQWITWDGKIWFATVYDCNGTFGGNGMGNSSLLTHHRVNSNTSPYFYAHKYYKDETEARYAQLRRLGILDPDHIFGKINDWVKRIGIEYYKQEFETWYLQPSINNATINSQFWEVVLDENDEPVTGNSNTYDPSVTYQIGDEVYSSFCRIYSSAFQFYSTNAGIYKFRCIKPNRGVYCFRNASLADNIWHLYKWYEAQLAIMDGVYNYSI